MNIGDIGEDLEAIDFAHTRFTEAVEGPCMEDYTSDEEAYQRLGEALQQLREAADRLIKRLPPGTLAVSRSRAPQEDWVTEESALRSSLDGCTKRVQELFTRTKVAEAALALANKEVERQKALMLEQTKLGTSFFDSYIEEREAKNELRAALALQVQENSELKRTIELFASTEEAKAMLAGFDDLKAGRLSSWTGRCEARTDVFGRCDLSAGHQGPHVNAIGDMWYWPSAAAPVKEHSK